MRRAVLLFVAGLLSFPAIAREQSWEWANAKAAFERYDPHNRVVAQVLLIAAGYQNWVPSERLTTNTFAGLRRFEAENGFAADGAIDDARVARLTAASLPLFAMWDFRRVGHPERGRPIWMPHGLAMQPQPGRFGVTFRDAQDRLFAAYNYLPNQRLERTYAALLDKMRREDTTVRYGEIKDGWFVISATQRDGQDQYVRYHRDGDGILGIVLFWNNAKGVVHGERVAILMSASLRAVMDGVRFVDPPVLNGTAPGPLADNSAARGREPALPPRPAVPPPVPAPVEPVPVPPLAGRVSTGTGFFVDRDGSFVTNNHVIAECNARILVRTSDGRLHRAQVAGTDARNDLALLTVADAGARTGALRLGARLGEGVAVFGFPHSDVLASSGNFTLGNVTAMAGIGDDSRFYQVSAPVQSGNSGGPLLDRSGNVIGVVSSKLNALKMAQASGDFPQNVNFAIKGNVLAGFLESNRVAVASGSAGGAALDPADLAEAARAISGFVACQ